MATTMPKHLLSKSTFMYGCQCPKRLWLHKFQPELRDEMDEEQVSIFQRGTDIGELARQLFPGGVNAAPPTPYEYQQSVADTARFVSEGHKVIYEAAFQYEGLLCAIDILVNKKGRWYAYEVKSSTGLKDPFVQDAAYQYYVISNSGLPLQDISVTHLNNKYIRRGALDLQQLFIHQSVKKEALLLQSTIAAKVNELKKVLSLKKVPAAAIGDHCYSPYECDFMGHCHAHKTPDEPEEKFINQLAIDEFLSPLQYPLYFMDFETWMSVVPECDGHWSYRQIPFQFSVHIQTKDGRIDHLPWLADHPHLPMMDFLTNLLAAMDDKGSVLVYNKAFENTILNQLKVDYPKFKKEIEKLQERLVDLMSPFRKNYRLPEMNWSYSIKNVLPALVPELSYQSLTIQDGAQASSAFYNLQFEKDADKVEEVRKALLDYCGLDTMAMVRILEKLRG